MSLGALALRNRVQTNEVDELNTPADPADGGALHP